MNTLTNQSTPKGPLNVSIIYDDADDVFLVAALRALGPCERALIISDNENFLKDTPGHVRLDFTAAGLDDTPIKLLDVSARIKAALPGAGPPSAIVVDMRWGLRTVSAAANFDRWGGLCDQIAETAGATVVSVYGTSLLIEDQLIAAMSGHSHFVAPSGVYENPFWLPPKYQSGATVSQQIGFVLGRLVPDYDALIVQDDVGDGAASGANPNWLSVPRHIRPKVGTDEIWKIRCFGRLRIYLSNGTQVKWDIAGSAPKKSKALFAYLLQRGERGAPTDLLAELLWSQEPDEDKKRKRLHHAVTMLRKTLGGRDYIRRNGDYYTLNPPDGTWIDIASFEQLCHRATVLSKGGKPDEAIALLDAADRLYSGDLFEDMSPEYFENDMEDWVVPKRTWLKDMGLKVLRDKAAILRAQGKFRDALESCHKALEMDPASTMVHGEIMHIFHAQKRGDAVARQYRQYLSALTAIGAKPESNELADLHTKLMKAI